MKKHNVLVFPAGSEIGIEIYNSLKYSHHVELFGVSGKSDHASYVYDKDRYVEGDFYITRSDFIDRFNKLIREWKIDFVYPTHDSICCFLAENQASIQAQVITSDSVTNRIARFKSQTYRLFRPYGLCPKEYAAPYGSLIFPVFLKPDDGQGGKGTHIPKSMDELVFHLVKSPELLVTEFLPGEELSVDCFTDFDRKLRFIGPRTRERVQMGISFRSTAVPVCEEISHIAHCINGTVVLNGAWFFQIKKDREGRYKLMEFAPRQSSTMGLYRHAGVNFALLSLFNALRKPVEILQNNYALQLDRCLQNRYDADFSFKRVYVDFDETLVKGSWVYPQAMAFLFQCRNQGVQIVLITKHRHDIYKTLRVCGISELLFEEIIQLSDGHNKCDFIDPRDAIFIDNHWLDRRDVQLKWGIPVFDADAIECLIR